jgi:hypothetical protein
MTNEDEHAVVHTSAGHRYTMIIAAYVKRALTICPGTANEQLQCLQSLNGLVDVNFTAEALQVIEPACDTFIEMVDEAMRANKDPNRCNESFAILTSPEVFRHLLQLNPSLLEAIRIGDRGRGPATEPAPAAAAAVPPARVNALSEYAPWPARPNGQPQYARGSTNRDGFDIFTGRPLDR